MDLVKVGIIKRKLTRKEAKQITKEVMASGLKDPNARLSLTILKTIETINNKTSKR